MQDNFISCAALQPPLVVHLEYDDLVFCSVDPNDQKKTACYDIDVEVEDPLKAQMSSFLLSTANQQEIASLDNKVGVRSSGNTQ